MSFPGGSNESQTNLFIIVINYWFLCLQFSSCFILILCYILFRSPNYEYRTGTGMELMDLQSLMFQVTSNSVEVSYICQRILWSFYGHEHQSTYPYAQLYPRYSNSNGALQGMIVANSRTQKSIKHWGLMRGTISLFFLQKI